MSEVDRHTLLFVRVSEGLGHDIGADGPPVDVWPGDDGATLSGSAKLQISGRSSCMRWRTLLKTDPTFATICSYLPRPALLPRRYAPPAMSIVLRIRGRLVALRCHDPWTRLDPSPSPWTKHARLPRSSRSNFTSIRKRSFARSSVSVREAAIRPFALFVSRSTRSAMPWLLIGSTPRCRHADRG